MTWLNIFIDILKAYSDGLFNLSVDSTKICLTLVRKS